MAEGDRAASNGTARAILQGRKYGLGCLLITQRTANVTKTILNQCNTIFAMRTFDETGKEFLGKLLGKGVRQRLIDSRVERQAVFFGRGSSCENPILIRLNDRADFVRVFRRVISATYNSGWGNGDIRLVFSIKASLDIFCSEGNGSESLKLSREE